MSNDKNVELDAAKAALLALHKRVLAKKRDHIFVIQGGDFNVFLDALLNGAIAIERAALPSDTPAEAVPVLTADEIEKIILSTEPLEMSERGDRIWARRMAEALRDRQFRPAPSTITPSSEGTVVRAHKHTCANVQPGSTYADKCDCGALDTAGNAIPVLAPTPPSNDTGTAEAVLPEGMSIERLRWHGAQHDSLDGTKMAKKLLSLASPSIKAPENERAKDGWIEWKGGECPVPGQPVDYRTRTGVGWAENATRVKWGYTGSFSDVVAYRVARRADLTNPTETRDGE